jgi:hypothetical protein
MRTAAVLTMIAALTLAGCNRGAEEKLPEDLNVAEVGNVDAPMANAMPAPPVENAANVAEPKAAPAPGFTEDQQMKDDADATGMTARLPEDEPVQKGNETRPAE